MRIRIALPTDAQNIAEIHAASWRYAYRGALSDDYLAGDIATERSEVWAKRFQSAPPSQHVVVAEIDEQIVGFACAYANKDSHWGALLDNIHVMQSMQRRGIGMKLIGAVARWCESTSPPEGLFLWVLQSNVQAQRFYQGLGASNVGTDVWSPPGGGTVPRYRYAWQSVQPLVQKRG